MECTMHLLRKTCVYVHRNSSQGAPMAKILLNPSFLTPKTQNLIYMMYRSLRAREHAYICACDVQRVIKIKNCTSRILALQNPISNTKNSKVGPIPAEKYKKPITYCARSSAGARARTWMDRSSMSSAWSKEHISKISGRHLNYGRKGVLPKICVKIRSARAP